ncbi:MAG: NUDIX domain-containing protein [archaeon]|nr:MAG: NUDIX domain-containing protein [archaeon]
MATELIEIVDEKDRPVGSAMLSEALEEGLLHRAVAVLVERKGGRFLLQQRNKRDLWQPGLWTLSCTGHVRIGETYLEAARRELKEELGLRSSLKPVSKILLAPIKSGSLTEHEWVVLFHSASNARARIDPVELEQVKDYSLASLERLAGSKRLTKDARILLRIFLRSRLRKAKRSR